jgi:uncharacterized membrane protein YbhN (UPF0104 family)
MSDAILSPPAPRLFRWLKKLGHALPLVIGALLLFWFSRSVDATGLVAALRQVSASAIALVVVCTTLATVLQGLRFFILFPASLGALAHVLLGFALQAGNILLPLRGGEALRPLYMRRLVPGLSLRSLAFFSLLDKLIEALCFAPFVLGFALLSARDPRFAFLRSRVTAVGLCALLIGGGATASYTMWKRRTRPEGAPLPDARALLWSVLLSLLVWAANFAIFYAVAPAGKLALSLLVAVNASLLLPGLPAGVGPYEAGFLWMGQLYGLARAPLVVAAIVSHSLQILSTLLIGLPVAFYMGHFPVPPQSAKPIEPPPRRAELSELAAHRR